MGQFDTKAAMNTSIKEKFEAAKSRLQKGLKIRAAHAVIENGPDSIDYVVDVFLETIKHYNGASYCRAQGRSEVMQKERGYLGYGYTVLKVEI